MTEKKFVWAVIEEEPGHEHPYVVKGVFTSKEDALEYAKLQTLLHRHRLHDDFEELALRVAEDALAGKKYDDNDEYVTWHVEMQVIDDIHQHEELAQWRAAKSGSNTAEKP